MMCCYLNVHFQGQRVNKNNSRVGIKETDGHIFTTLVTVLFTSSRN